MYLHVRLKDICRWGHGAIPCYAAYMNYQWTVTSESAGKRLDVFIARQLPEVTRSQITKYLKRGAGTVNGKQASVHQFLRVGDAVEFEPEGTHTTAQRHSVNEAPGVTIVHETPDWIVVNKPTGLLVHGGIRTTSGTLVDALIAHHPALAHIGGDPARPGIVHRLDKDTSGLMVVAKSQFAFEDLKRQFAERTVDKRYLAFVYGEMKQDEGDIKFRIARSKTKQRMAARPEHEQEGRAAWTHYKVLKRFRTATLIELQLLTGRTHQIRAHLFAMNHPVVGDPLYKRKTSERNIQTQRLLLQSVYLGFRDPATGEKRAFTLLPEPEFERCLATIS